MGINVLPPKQHLKTLHFWLTITKNPAPSCTFFLKWDIPQHYETKHRRILLVLKPIGGGQCLSHRKYCYKQNNDIDNII